MAPLVDRGGGRGAQDGHKSTRAHASGGDCPATASLSRSCHEHGSNGGGSHRQHGCRSDGVRRRAIEVETTGCARAPVVLLVGRPPPARPRVARRLLEPLRVVAVLHGAAEHGRRAHGALGLRAGARAPRHVLELFQPSRPRDVLPAAAGRGAADGRRPQWMWECVHASSAPPIDSGPPWFDGARTSISDDRRTACSALRI